MSFIPTSLWTVAIVSMTLSVTTCLDVTIPQNSAVVETSSAVLPCKTNKSDDDPSINWIYYKSSNALLAGEGQIMFNGQTRRSSSSRISHNSTSGRCDLVIQSVRMSDAGIYACEVHRKWVKKRDRYFAYLTVLASNPTCTMNPEEEEFLQGETVTLTCTINFSGVLAPVMEWVGIDDTKSIDMTSNDTVSSTLTHTFAPKNHGVRFICKTFFDHTSMNLSSGFALNAPEYNFQWMTPIMTILYGPHNVTISPAQDVYYPGDVLNCTASGNPLPTYDWIDQETSEVHPGQQLIINETMINARTHRFKCRATNFVEGRDITWQGSYEFLFLVQKQLEEDSTKDNHTVLIVVVVVVADVVVVTLIILSVIICKRMKTKLHAKENAMMKTIQPHVYDEIELPPEEEEDNVQDPVQDGITASPEDSNPSTAYTGLVDKRSSLPHPYTRASVAGNQNMDICSSTKRTNTMAGCCTGSD